MGQRTSVAIFSAGNWTTNLWLLACSLVAVLGLLLRLSDGFWEVWGLSRTAE
jgi:hypothetical protein